MGCSYRDRCGIPDSGRLSASARSVIKLSYCDSADGFTGCQRFQCFEKGETPDRDLLPGGGQLPAAAAVQGSAREEDFRWRLHTRTPDFSIGTYGPVLMIHWQSRVTEDGLMKSSAQSDALIAEYGDVAAIITSSSFIPMPSPGLLGLSARLIQKATGTQLSVTVIEGNGFWARTARICIDTIAKLASVPYPVKTAASIDVAGQMAADSLGLSPACAVALATLCRDFVDSGERAA